MDNNKIMYQFDEFIEKVENIFCALMSGYAQKYRWKNLVKI